MKTLQVIDLLNDGFRNTMKKVCKLPLDQKHALRIMKTAKVIEDQYGEYTRLKDELLQKYGQPGEDGELLKGDKGGVQMSKENLGLFAADHAELIEAEFNVDGFSVKDLQNARLSVEDLMYLDPILTD